MRQGFMLGAKNYHAIPSESDIISYAPALSRKLVADGGNMLNIKLYAANISFVYYIMINLTDIIPFVC
jgi:hypothetical protein